MYSLLSSALVKYQWQWMDSSSVPCALVVVVVINNFLHTTVFLTRCLTAGTQYVADVSLCYLSLHGSFSHECRRTISSVSWCTCLCGSSTGNLVKGQIGTCTCSIVTLCSRSGRLSSLIDNALRKKGFGHALRGMSLLHSPHLKLLINQCTRQLKQLTIKEWVYFLFLFVIIILWVGFQANLL